MENLVEKYLVSESDNMSGYYPTRSINTDVDKMNISFNTKKRKQALQKIKKSLKSAKTEKQIDTVEKMMHNFMKMYGDTPWQFIKTELGFNKGIFGQPEMDYTFGDMIKYKRELLKHNKG